jgi:hypothetical protein
MYAGCVQKAILNFQDWVLWKEIDNQGGGINFPNSISACFKLNATLLVVNHFISTH